MDSNTSESSDTTTHYIGFWPRVGASLLDSVLLMLIIIPILISAYGWEYFLTESAIAGPLDIFLNWILPLITILAFWIYRQATPGKMAISAQIVDAKTGGKPSTLQFVIRYIGYYVAAIPLGLGIFWVAWDKKKQGWHDKMASTVVINPK